MPSNTVVPHSEELRRALQWISDRREDEPGVKTATLISQAGARFNLSPADQEALLGLLSADVQGSSQG